MPLTVTVVWAMPITWACSGLTMAGLLSSAARASSLRAGTTNAAPPAVAAGDGLGRSGWSAWRVACGAASGLESSAAPLLAAGLTGPAAAASAPPTTPLAGSDFGSGTLGWRGSVESLASRAASVLWSLRAAASARAAIALRTLSLQPCSAKSARCSSPFFMSMKRLPASPAWRLANTANCGAPAAASPAGASESGKLLRSSLSTCVTGRRPYRL